MFFDVITVTRTRYFNNVMDTNLNTFLHLLTFTFSMHTWLPGNNCKIDLRKSKRGKQNYYWSNVVPFKILDKASKKA